MQELISLAVITGALFLVSIVLFFAGIIRRKLNFMLLSLAFFLGSIATGIYTGLRVVGKSVRVAREVLRPRSGPEIYAAQFGSSPHGCTQILRYQDQRIKRLDYTIWLHFRTCPAELKRILDIHGYKAEFISTAGWSGYNERDKVTGSWFRPQQLGDSILVFRSYGDNGGGHEMYVSTDSTEVYYKDFLD